MQCRDGGRIVFPACALMTDQQRVRVVNAPRLDAPGATWQRAQVAPGAQFPARMFSMMAVGSGRLIVGMSGDTLPGREAITVGDPPMTKDFSLSRRAVLTTGAAAVAGAAFGLEPAHALAGWGTPQDRTTAGFWNVSNGTYVSFDWGYIKSSQVRFHTGGIDLTITKRATPISAGGKTRSWDTPWLTLKPERFWTYGRMEVEATLPTSTNCPDGMWPAFWGRAQGGKGEIDLVESWYPRFTRSRPTYLLGTTTSSLHNYSSTGTHYLYNKTNEENINGVVTNRLANGHDSWGTRHKWAVEKRPDSVRFLFDDKVVSTATRATHPGIFTTGFDGLKFDFRLCIAVGDGYWTNPPRVKTGEVSKTMRVHRVTYWPTA